MTADAHASPRMVVRVAALPTAALDELRFEKTWRGITETREYAHWLRAEGEALADALYPVIGACPPALKPALVALRRSLFAARPMRDRFWNDDVRQALPDSLVAAIVTWRDRLADHDRCLAELPVRFATELAAGTPRLRAAVSRPEFRFGLVQGSPTLATELTKWLSTPDSTPVGRQTRLRLVKYLARVVAKTSPYSTFTLSGVPGWQPADGAGPGVRATGSWRWRSAVELNVWLVQRLCAALTGHPAVLARLPLRTNPSLVREADNLQFLSAGPGMPIAGLRAGEAVSACLRLVDEGAAGTLDALRQALVELDPHLDPGEVTGFLNRLVQVGLLQPVAPVPDQSDDHLDELAGWLAAAPVPGLGQLAEAVRALRTQLLEYAAEPDPDRRLAGHQAIHRLCAGIFGEPGLADGAALPAKNLFHENAVLTEPVLACTADAWRPVLDDLTRLRRLFALHAPNLAGRRAVAAFFADRFGAGRTVPWLHFQRELNRFLAAGDEARSGELTGRTLRTICSGPVFTPARQWRSLPFAAELAEVSDAVTAAVRGVPPDPDGVIRIDPAMFERLASGWPPDVLPAASMACYLQPVEAAGGFQVVLNGVTIGHGRGFSRLSRLARLMAAEPEPGHRCEAAAPRHGSDALVVECDGAFGSNLNLRDHHLPAGLDFPFTTGMPCGQRRVALRELVVDLDPGDAVLTLRHGPGGPPVQVVQTGMMAEFFLPPPLRGLMELFGPASTLMHSGFPLFLPHDHDPRTDGPGMLRRVEVGRVVVARGCWAFAGRAVPTRAKGADDLTHWRRLADWAAGHGLPERCYVRAMPVEGQMSGADLKSRKPLYVDFATWDLVALLERALGRPDDLLVVFSEALPDLSQAPRYGAGRHVTELIVEVTDDRTGD